LFYCENILNIIIIINFSKFEILEPVPSKLEMFLIFSSFSRSSYVPSSLLMVLESHSLWSIHVLPFQTIQPVFSEVLTSLLLLYLFSVFCLWQCSFVTSKKLC